MVHGREGLALAERETAALFGGGDDADMPAIELSASAIRRRHVCTPTSWWRRLAPSKGEAARPIKQGGFYMNDARVTEERGRSPWRTSSTATSRRGRASASGGS